GQLWYAWADANRYTPVTRAIHLMPWPQPLRMGDFFESVGWVSPQEQIRLPSFSDGDRYPLKPLDCKPGASPPNILLIVLDAWRHDMLGPGTTPNLWEYSRKSWVFSHHYAAANETRYGVFGMFYGLVGSYWTTMLGQSRGPVLMDELVNQGYRMGVYGSAALTSPEFDRTVFVRVRDSIPLSTPGADMAQKDMEITRRFLAFLDQPSPKPFFGFLFYDAPHAYEYPDQAHAPFQPVWNSINYSELNPDFDPLPFVNRYKNAVHFADSEAAKVLQALARKGLDKTTVVVITADHGQEFNDTGHNYWGHGGNFSDAQVRVPLVIHWPGEPPRVFTHMTSQLDLAPTLLTRALGCKTDPALYSNGRLLLRQDPRPFMMVSSGTRFGLVEADRITVVEDFGEIQVVDKNLNPMKAEPDGAKLKQVLDEMRKF
ncbi:MAG: sulfatase-like hydrolase/transferase, partial [Deltaproteobacteria bacterium]|nr:sulfatase-like hydrolase/transferase [Deltaproteobacteria bacterium]